MNEIETHEIAAILPEMGEAEYNDLKDSIQRNGLRRPIVMLGTKVLAGRHRMRACQELKIQPAIRQYDAQKDGPLPLQYVLDEDVIRRHLTPDQRAIIAAKLWDQIKAAKPGADATPEEDPDGDIEMTTKPSGEVSNDTEAPAIVVDGTEDDTDLSALPKDKRELLERLKVGSRKLDDAIWVQKRDPEILKDVEKGLLTLDEAREKIELRESASNYRKEASDLIAGGHGDDFAEKCRNQEVLVPDRELKSFMGYGISEQRDIVKLLERDGTFSVKKAARWVSGGFSANDTIGEALEWADWLKGQDGRRKPAFSLAGKKISIA